MRVALGIVLAALTGCGELAGTGPEPAPGNGRYVGVGLYAPHEGWQRQREVPPPAGDRAGLADDDIVIVVTDSRTGEIRQCGNVSGHCTVMNPWGKAPLAVPVRLDRSRAAGDEAATAVGKKDTRAVAK
ncbi:hypothetical protein IP88_08195 [alpha proteobacterium AAP81b]|nr:hypothetical protein IP88_08195 [alpha proteobacterium AAP81b]